MVLLPAAVPAWRKASRTIRSNSWSDTWGFCDLSIARFSARADQYSRSAARSFSAGVIRHGRWTRTYHPELTLVVSGEERGEPFELPPREWHHVSASIPFDKTATLDEWGLEEPRVEIRATASPGDWPVAIGARPIAGSACIVAAPIVAARLADELPQPGLPGGGEPVQPPGGPGQPPGGGWRPPGLPGDTLLPPGLDPSDPIIKDPGLTNGSTICPQPWCQDVCPGCYKAIATWDPWIEAETRHGLAGLMDAFGEEDVLIMPLLSSGGPNQSQTLLIKSLDGEKDAVFFNYKSNRNPLLSGWCEDASNTIDFDHLPVYPIVEVDQVFVDFAGWSVSELQEDAPQRLVGNYVLSENPVPTADGDYRVVGVLRPATSEGAQAANLGARLPRLGQVRAVGATSAVTQEDWYWATGGSAIGSLFPYTGLLDRFSNGRWRPWVAFVLDRPYSPGAWMTQLPNRRMIANNDLVEIILHYEHPVPTRMVGDAIRVVTFAEWIGDVEAIEAGRWLLDHDRGLGYAALPPDERYRHRVGIRGASSPMVGMDDVRFGYLAGDARERLDYTFPVEESEFVISLMQSPSGCYVHWDEFEHSPQRDHIIARFDQIELQFSPDLAGGAPPPLSVDAGSAFLGRPGQVALPVPGEGEDRVDTSVGHLIDLTTSP